MIKLKEARESKGIMQKAVAEYLGVSRQTYAVYEAHPENMSVEQACSVCEYLGLDVRDIFFARKVSSTNET